MMYILVFFICKEDSKFFFVCLNTFSDVLLFIIGGVGYEKGF